MLDPFAGYEKYVRPDITPQKQTEDITKLFKLEESPVEPPTTPTAPEDVPTEPPAPTTPTVPQPVPPAPAALSQEDIKAIAQELALMMKGE